MKYWLTTHWPHLLSGRREAPHEGVWVAADKFDVIRPMAVGDLVWVYESQSGRPILKKGSTGRIRHHAGRGGVVTLAQVTSTPTEDEESEPETYSNGTRIWWKWRADTRSLNSAGFVSRAMLNRIFGYSDKHVFRGFGTRKSGLAEISFDVHQQIHAEYLASHAESDARGLRQGRASLGGGGEGPIHLALKNAVARNPSEVLGEEGLKLEQVEYPFLATGDRVDVLLSDKYGRYVTVEIEPACPVDHLAGPLQCMKYRSLLAYKLGREPDEVRTFLVAHHIHDEVRTRAERYGIECYEVPAE